MVELLQAQASDPNKKTKKYDPAPPAKQFQATGYQHPQWPAACSSGTARTNSHPKEALRRGWLLAQMKNRFRTSTGGTNSTSPNLTDTN
jgi:hypothetical protein